MVPQKPGLSLVLSPSKDERSWFDTLTTSVSWDARAVQWDAAHQELTSRRLQDDK